MNDSADARLRLGNCGQDAQDNQKQERPEAPTLDISSVHLALNFAESLAKLLPDGNS